MRLPFSMPLLACGNRRPTIEHTDGWALRRVSYTSSIRDVASHGTHVTPPSYGTEDRQRRTSHYLERGIAENPMIHRTTALAGTFALMCMGHVAMAQARYRTTGPRIAGIAPAPGPQSQAWGATQGVAPWASPEQLNAR